MNAYDYTCKYCLESIIPTNDEDKDNIISPCNCRGSMNYVHIECFKHVKKKSCEICRLRYPNTNIFSTINRNSQWGVWSHFNDLNLESRVNLIHNLVLNASYTIYNGVRDLSFINNALNFSALLASRL